MTMGMTFPILDHVTMKGVLFICSEVLVGEFFWAVRKKAYFLGVQLKKV